MDRRAFLGRAARVGGAVALGGAALAACDDGRRDTAAERAAAAPTILDGKASDAPVDTVVVLMMENRSFDHYLGWLADDGDYVEAGRRTYGRGFRLDGRQDLRYRAAGGDLVPTALLTEEPDQPDPWRGCGHPVPGHGWLTGRVQRDAGFIAPGTGNDEFALGYYGSVDLPLYSDLARRFTLADHSFASLLAGTFPNRQYLHAATSNGRKEDPIPLEIGIYEGETIWDRLQRAGVSARYYYVDLPILALWGERQFPHIASLDEYFDDAERGRLPHVVFLDPGFRGPARTDDHPLGSVHLGQRFVQSVFRAFAQSPQWNRGAFVLTYDEWGGFFDHVRPPVFADDRRSPIDVENFGQAGFRVPTVVASPYARRGFVDHRPLDHTSILRFLEWRFLGAPPEGPRRTSDGEWWLTKRDRHANNLGASLVTVAEPEVGIDLDATLPPAQYLCGPGDEVVDAAFTDPGTLDVGPLLAGLSETRFREATDQPWL